MYEHGNSSTEIINADRVTDNGFSGAIGTCPPDLEYIDWSHQDVTPTEVKLSIIGRQKGPTSLLNSTIGL